jgi:hypothetical protein
MMVKIPFDENNSIVGKQLFHGLLVVENETLGFW